MDNELKSSLKKYPEEKKTILGLAWVLFKCPKCQKNTHYGIGDKRFANIEIMAIPGPDWRVIDNFEVNELTTIYDENTRKVVCDLGKNRYEIPLYQDIKK